MDFLRDSWYRREFGMGEPPVSRKLLNRRVNIEKLMLWKRKTWAGADPGAHAAATPYLQKNLRIWPWIFLGWKESLKLAVKFMWSAPRFLDPPLVSRSVSVQDLTITLTPKVTIRVDLAACHVHNNEMQTKA
jgi:hypothetical protein